MDASEHIGPGKRWETREDFERSMEYWDKRWGAQAIAEDSPADERPLTDWEKRSMAVLDSGARRTRLNQATGEWEIVES